nr:glycosyltransferase [Lachnospiraceae bacterium]
MEMVSVVIPVHNAEAFLAETLDSVYAQRDSGIPLEIVAVDDRSTDGSRRVLEEWAENHGDISLRIIDNENAAGPAGARNTGI